MLWDFNQDLAEKLLRLALCPSAPQGEWQAAALAYFRAMRAAGATLRGKRAAGCRLCLQILASQVRAIEHLAKAVAHEGGPRRE
jgi:hypothetical protein